MQSLGLIGGTGLEQWEGSRTTHDHESRFGQSSAVLSEFHIGGLRVFFLPRHGIRHSIPPHAVNYRANVDVLRQAGVEGIVAVNAVGGIASHSQPGILTIPDQLIDYTEGRAHTFSLTADDDLHHIEFSQPFDGQLRPALIRAAAVSNIEITNHGCIAVTQGPRLETAAEIKRLERDGCDLVGMTTMPEAALAREAGLDYASVCVTANRAAGLDDQPVTMEAIEATLAHAMAGVRKLLKALFKELSNVNQ